MIEKTLVNGEVLLIPILLWQWDHQVEVVIILHLEFLDIFIIYLLLKWKKVVK